MLDKKVYISNKAFECNSQVDIKAQVVYPSGIPK